MITDHGDEWNGRYRPEHDVKLLTCSSFVDVSVLLDQAE